MTPQPRAVPLYIGGAALSLFGNSAIGIVLPWLVLVTTGSLASAGLIAACAGIAAVPATFVGGQLIDRLGARTVAVGADVGSATAVLGLVVVDATVGLSVPWFVVLGAAGALFDIPGMTARQSMLAGVARMSGTPVDRLAGLFQAAFSLAFLAGPGIAGFLLTVLDPIDVVWITAACSAGAALLTRAVPEVERPEAWAGGPREGGSLAVVRRSPALRAMLLVAFSASLVTPPMISVVLPGHFNRLGDPDQLGLAMSGFAVGTLAGSVLYAVVAKASRRTAYVTGLVAMTVGFWLFAQLTGFWVVAAGTLVMGVGSGLFGPIWNVYVAERVPDDVRGRVLGLLTGGGLVAGPIGLGIVALLLTQASLGTTAMVLAAGWTGVAAYAITSRGARGLTDEPEGTTVDVR